MEKAQLILTAAPIVPKDEESALAVAGILVAAQDLGAAASLLDAAAERGPRIAAARSLVSVLIGKDVPPEARFAAFLDRLSRKDFEGARAAVASLRDPLSLKEQWTAIVAIGEAAPNAAKAIAQDLARARLFHDSGIFADKADLILRTFAEKGGAAAAPFDLFRAWWKLERGEAKAAADIVVPMMETRSKTAMVLLTASLAGIKLVGDGAAMRLIESAGASVPEAFLSDLVRLLAAQGMHDTAVNVYPRLTKPDETDRAIRFLIAVERREAKEAEKLLATLGDAITARPELRAGRLWVLSQNEKTKAQAASEIRSLLALPAELKQVDKIALYEAAILAGLTTEATALLKAELQKARFSSEILNRYAAVLRTLKTDKVGLEKIEEWLRIVDPTGKLRTPTPRPITLDPQ